MTRPPLREDAGMTLAELMVSMALTLIVSALITNGLILVHRAQRSTADEYDARTAATRAAELLSRDLGSAEDVPVAQASTVTAWVDANSDYARQPAELQVWTYDATRGALCRTAAGVPHCVGAPWIRGLALSYVKSADGTRVVRVKVDISYASKPSTKKESWSVTIPAVAP